MPEEPYRDEALLRRRYLDEGASMNLLAAEFGCSVQSIHKWLHRFGVPTRPKGGRPNQLDSSRSPVQPSERYGRLLVLAREGTRHKTSTWLCLCDCGTETVVKSADLSKGATTSCGCYRRELSSAQARRHGHAAHDQPSGSTPTYRSWSAMRTRCLNPRSKDWVYYGARGITVCDRWSEPDGQGFVNFLADMGQRPDARTLDRIDNDGNYEPANCRWATAVEQIHNRRPTSRPTAGQHRA